MTRPLFRSNQLSDHLRSSNVANQLPDYGDPWHDETCIKRARPHWTSSVRQVMPPNLCSHSSRRDPGILHVSDHGFDSVWFWSWVWLSLALLLRRWSSPNIGDFPGNLSRNEMFQTFIWGFYYDFTNYNFTKWHSKTDIEVHPSGKIWFKQIKGLSKIRVGESIVISPYYET